MDLAPDSEPVRAVIWDLDETFWTGTLTEGGITYRQDMHDTVVALAARGIVSSICSKNDIAPVRALLEARGIWDYFVLPSIDWQPKGARLAGLVAALQLRAPTILFIDDNPANLAEAQAAVPGLQVARETILPSLLDHALLRGKSDPGLTRLAQYRTLARRLEDQTSSVGDNTAFLRQSGIEVRIDHDIETSIDRAIELINRTNQLNFTKERLPEDPQAARAALLSLIGGFRTQAGLLWVRDRYGDHGACGFYAVTTGARLSSLQHFCFSCRILNMGVETWLYQRLGRPQINVVGEVLGDLTSPVVVDWIKLAVADQGQQQRAAPRIDHVFARGGCELMTMLHYFKLTARTALGEFDEVRDGRRMLWQHSTFARLAIEGISPAQRAAAHLLGYQDGDFDSYLAAPETGDGTSIWVLSFMFDCWTNIYRHRATGLTLPLPLPLPAPQSAGEARAPRVQALPDDIAAAFDCLGLIGEDDFKHNLRLILKQAPQGTRVFILMPKDRWLTADGKLQVARPRDRLNLWTQEVLGAYPDVVALQIADFVPAAERMNPDRHFDRMTYFRLYEHIMGAAVGPVVGG